MYNKNELAVIWIDMFDFLTYHKKLTILNYYSEPAEVFSCFKFDFNDFSNILSKEEFDKMVNFLDEQNFENYVQNLNKQNIICLTFYSEKYPKSLLNFEDYPLILYCKGDIELLSSTCIAVVGSRKITRYGRDITEKFTRSLASSGVTIVSGLAMGVDTVAHQTTLDCGGKTIAVMASGYNEIYPTENFELEKKIENCGLVITEYLPDSKPAPYRFPIRNRIIAGISEGVLITEASMKSGVMHTKNYALENGIDLFVVPGNVDNFSSAGCNAILKACQGSLVTSADDILEKLNMINAYKPKVVNLKLSLEEQMILNCLDGEVHFDELLERTKLDTKTLLSLLTTLELSGIIKKLTGNFYCK